MNLKEMEQPTYRNGQCEVCGSFVADARQHTTWHREIVSWLRNLRDGKVDGCII